MKAWDEAGAVCEQLTFSAQRWGTECFFIAAEDAAGADSFCYRIVLFLMAMAGAQAVLIVGA